jgi:hypothetical protein
LIPDDCDKGQVAAEVDIDQENLDDRTQPEAAFGAAA